MLFSYDFGKYTDVEGFSPLAVDGTAVIGIRYEDGEFLLYFYGADPAGKDVFVIEAGELLVSPHVWDYQSTGARFIIRDQPTDARPGRIILDVEKTDLGFKVNRGTVVHNGRGLDIYPDKVVTIPDYVTMSAFTVKDHYIGIAFGHETGSFLNYP